MTALLEKARTRRRDPAPSRPPVSLELVLTVVLLLAFGAAAVLGVAWWAAASSAEIERAHVREAVLADARQAAINLPSLDYQHAEEGIDRWIASSTGQLHEEFVSNRDRYVQVVKQAKRKTKASITDAAVAELDEVAGTARVLVGVDVTVTPEQGPPVVSRQRLNLGMTRTAEGWRASKVSPVGTPTVGPN
jgi:Mce-associated membrane protein